MNEKELTHEEFADLVFKGIQTFPEDDQNKILESLQKQTVAIRATELKSVAMERQRLHNSFDDLIKITGGVGEVTAKETFDRLEKAAY